MYFDQYYILIVRGFGRKYQSFSLSYELNGLVKELVLLTTYYTLLPLSNAHTLTVLQFTNLNYMEIKLNQT